MKTIACVVVVAWVSQFAIGPSALAQYFGARNYMKRLSPPAPAPARPAPPAVAAPAPPAIVPAQPVDPEKAKAEKEAAVKRAVEFQKQRAEAGSATAQYDLAMRYLNGDGVEKDLAAAKKWLEAAAKNGHTLAPQKLEELKQQEQPNPATWVGILLLPLR